MSRFLLLLCSAMCLVGCAVDDSPLEQASPEAFSVSVAGEYWGVYGDLNGYGLDAQADCSSANAGHEAIITFDPDDAFPSFVDCSAIGGNVGFSLDLTACDLDSRAQRVVTGCAIDEGVIEVLEISTEPTYDDGSSSSDVYGDLYLLATLPDGSTLEVSGPFSHCNDGQPCN